MADIHVPEVKTRIFSEKGVFVLDAAFWPQCGFEFPAPGSGTSTSHAQHEIQSAVMGTTVNSVNLVFSEDQQTAYIDVQV